MRHIASVLAGGGWLWRLCYCWQIAENVSSCCFCLPLCWLTDYLLKLAENLPRDLVEVAVPQAGLLSNNGRFHVCSRSMFCIWTLGFSRSSCFYAAFWQEARGTLVKSRVCFAGGLHRSRRPDGDEPWSEGKRSQLYCRLVFDTLVALRRGRFYSNGGLQTKLKRGFDVVFYSLDIGRKKAKMKISNSLGSKLKWPWNEWKKITYFLLKQYSQVSQDQQFRTDEKTLNTLVITEAHNKIRL